MIDRPQLIAQLIRAEGCVLHAYPDSTPEGYLTIGVGRLIDKRLGGGLSRDEALLLLDNDINRADEACHHFSWYSSLDQARQNAVCELMFNLGPVRLAKFVRFLAALQAHQYPTAAIELRDSLWAQQVQPERRDQLIRQIQLGVF